MTTPLLTATPQPADILSVSQSDLLDNFNYFEVALTKDHQLSYNTNASTTAAEGLHRKVSLIVSGSANPAIPAGANGLLYHYANNLYWKASTSATGVQMTNVASGTPSNATNGWTFLPGGLVLQWGQGTNTSNPYPVNFPLTFSAIPYSVTITINYPSVRQTFVNSSSITAASFNVYCAISTGTILNQNFQWMAIGPK